MIKTNQKKNYQLGQQKTRQRNFWSAVICIKSYEKKYSTVSCQRRCQEWDWTSFFFRDEFLYKVYNLFKDSPDQMHAIGNLIQLLYYGGFLRSKNGLNSLPVFIKFADILHKPNGFKLIIGNISISNFVRNSTQAWPHRMVSNLRIKLKSFQLINTGQSSTCTIFPQTSLNWHTRLYWLAGEFLVIKLCWKSATVQKINLESMK